MRATTSTPRAHPVRPPRESHNRTPTQQRGRVPLPRAALSIRVPPAGFTALLAAAWYGHAVVAERLLTAGASKDRQLPNGATALYLGCRNGHKDVVDRLLEKGADPTLTRWSDRSHALGKAAEYGHAAICEVLLVAAADDPRGNIAEQADSSGATPLALAARRGHIPAVQALL